MFFIIVHISNLFYPLSFHPMAKPSPELLYNNSDKGHHCPSLAFNETVPTSHN